MGNCLSRLIDCCQPNDKRQQKRGALLTPISDPPGQTRKQFTRKSEDFDEEHISSSRTPLLFADTVDNVQRSELLLGSDVTADSSKMSIPLLCADEADHMKDSVKRNADGNGNARSFQQTGCRNAASQTEEGFAVKRVYLDACGEDLIQLNDTEDVLNSQHRGGNPIKQGVSSDVSTSISDLTQLSHEDTTQKEDISTAMLGLIAVSEIATSTERVMLSDACTSTSDLTQLSPPVESTAFDKSGNPTGLSDRIGQDLFSNSPNSGHPSRLAECMAPLAHAGFVDPFMPAVPGTVNSTRGRTQKTVGKDLSQDSQYSDEENTTPKRPGSVTSDTISLSIEDEEPLSAFNDEGRHHETETKTTVSPSDPALARQESGTARSLFHSALSIPETGADSTLDRALNSLGSGTAGSLPEFVDLAVSRQSSSGHAAIGPAVIRQESADVTEREVSIEGTLPRMLNIERVGNLFIEVLTVCDEIGTGEEGCANPVCFTVDWEGARQRAIDAARRAAEERVHGAERELDKEKKRGVMRMKNLAEGYIREWRNDVLEREVDRDRERQKYFDRMQEMEKEAGAQIARLQELLLEERRQSEELVADVIKQLEPEQEQPSSSFILRAQHVEENILVPRVAETMSSGLESVVQRLYRDFHVRLLAGNKGLLFLMEALTAQWATVQGNQEGVRRLLEELLPEAIRGKVRWTEVREYGSVRAKGVHVGRAVPEEILVCCGVPSDRSQGTSTWNPMTANLRRIFGPVKPVTAEDLRNDGPGVGAMAVTESGRIVVLDWRNKTVKVANFNPLAHPATGTESTGEGVQGEGEGVDDHGVWTCVQLRTKLFSMTLVSGEVVAVTASMQKLLFVVDVSGGEQPDVTQVATQRLYYGICSVPSDGTLIVGSKQDSDGLSSLYQITQQAVVLRTIVDSTMQLELCTPFHLCFSGSTIVVSNTERHNVLLFDFFTGGFKEMLHDSKNLKGPRQVAMDKNGHLFIACVNRPSECVTVVSPDRRWRRLLEGRNAEEGDPPRLDPIGLALTDYGLVVSWHEWDSHSVVCVYSWK